MKIGFVDLYISEWHANNYPAWLKDIDSDCTVAYAWAEEDISPLDGKSTDEWCLENGTERCMTIDELCEKSDCIIILAPSNPEKHLEYAKAVLKHGKLTYIDKTFAPNLAEAKEIFKLGEEYGTRFFSTSALRYADELEKIIGTKNLITTGGGNNLPEYLIHQVEMAVKTLSGSPVRVRMEEQGSQRIFTVKYNNGNSWTGMWSPVMRFSICGDAAYTAVASDFFKNLMSEIIKFFKTGALPFDSSQTLKVMALRDAVLLAMEKPNEWIEI